MHPCPRTVVALALLLVCGCRTVVVQREYAGAALDEAVARSNELVSRRQAQAASKTPAEKAAYFTAYIRARMDEQLKLVPKYYVNDRPLFVNIEFTAHYLAALAYKYAATGDHAVVDEIRRLQEGVLAMDRANGFDGYLPFKGKVEDGRFTIVRNEAHANVYTQLLFAYAALYRLVPDDAVRDHVRRHVGMIIDHFRKDDFNLHDNHGNEVEYSDLSPRRFTLQHNRQLALLVMVDVGLACLHRDDRRHAALSRLRHRLLHKYDYAEAVQKQRAEVFGLHFPTHSSSWLNMLNFYTGMTLTNAPCYRRGFDRLYAHYAAEQNPLYDLMRLLTHQLEPSRASALVRRVRHYLETFPLVLTRAEVISSLRPGVETARSPYIKLKRIDVADEPLPVYMRPLTSYEWKRNQRRVDGNFPGSADVRYTGIDFLQAWWMLRYYKTRQ